MIYVQSCIVMEKIIERNLLFDFYGELLTEHQKDIYRSAVYEDLSLSELSEQFGITRQGVHDLMKRCDKILTSYEDKLHLIEKFMNIKEYAGSIEACIVSGDIDKNEIHELTEKILTEL